MKEGGESHAGEWTAADDARLRALVNHAHRLGYWLRFYTLDGFTPAESQGWNMDDNFGSKKAVFSRWRAAIAAGVNFVATDQYEEFATYMQQYERSLRPNRK